MTPERWQQIEELYHAALAQDACDRAAFLAKACAGDESLRLEVESLVAYQEEAERFIETPALEKAAKRRGHDPRPTLSGRRMGSHYRLVSRLGEGGMGVVYRAIDERLEREVAIKVLPPNLSEERESLSRFTSEARAASALNHPNIVTVYEIDEVDGIPFIAMELIDGDTLRARLEAGPFPLGDALGIAEQIALALAAAHEKGIVHRDVKPENVMLRPDGYAKVLDFGVATLRPLAVAGASQSTGTFEVTGGAFVGTPGYLSPEQIDGTAADARSDIFSFGVLLCEMTTGTNPFKRASVLETLNAIAQTPVPAGPLIADLPPVVGGIITKALQKAPDDRYQSMADVVADLRRARQAVEVTATRAPVPESSLRFRRIPLVAAATVIAVAIAIFAWRTLERSERPTGGGVPVVAVLPFVNLSGDASRDYLGIGVADTLTADLAGLSGIAVVSRDRSTISVADKRDFARIARDLGVSLVVDGGVQQTANRLKLTVRLVRPDGTVVWGGSYEGAVAELFAIESQLAHALSDALELRLTRTENQRLGRQPTVNMEAFADYAQGRAFLERLDMARNLDRAIDLFSAAIQKDPLLSLAHAGLGEAYWARYQQTRDAQWTIKAREATLEALRLDPEQATVRLSLAVIYRGTGDVSTAIDELRRALVLQPNSDEAHRMLGEMLADSGQIDAAIGEFRQGIALRPNFWGNYNALGLALYRAGRFKDAVTAFTRVTELQPDNTLGFQRLGTVYHAAGDTANAVVNYQRALELAPTANASANLGFLYYEQRRFAESANAYRQALKLDPNSDINYRNLGDVLQRLGRPKEARAAYTTAVEIAERMLRVNPNDALTLSQCALYEAKLGRRTDADRHTDRAVSLAPADGQVLYNQAVVYALTGRKEASLKALEQALARGASASVARTDDDLQLIRNMPGFERVFGQRH